MNYFIFSVRFYIPFFSKLLITNGHVWQIDFVRRIRSQDKQWNITWWFLNLVVHWIIIIWFIKIQIWFLHKIHKCNFVAHLFIFQSCRWFLREGVDTRFYASYKCCWKYNKNILVKCLSVHPQSLLSLILMALMF